LDGPDQQCGWPLQLDYAGPIQRDAQLFAQRLHLSGVHYTGDQAAIAEGDNCLSIIIPQIMASAAYQDHGVIIIWTDETESTDDTNTTLP
jgi:hypothetical protein